MCYVYKKDRDILYEDELTIDERNKFRMNMCS